MKFFNIFHKKSQVNNRDELDELLEFCGGDMWFLMREYKQRNPDKSIKEIRKWLGVDDEDLDIKDAWNDKLFFQVWNKTKMEIKDK